MRRLAPGTTSAPLPTTRLVTTRLVTIRLVTIRLAARHGPKPIKWRRQAAVASRETRPSPACPQSAGELIHGLGELDVELGQAAGIVGRQRDSDIFVDVEPFGTVIELFRHQRGTRHEAEGLIEIGKDEFLGDGVATADLGPAFEPGERSLARFAGEFLSHLENSVYAADRGRVAQNFPARSRPAKPHHVGNTASRGAVPGCLLSVWPDLAGIDAKVGSQGRSRLRLRHPLRD